MNYVEQLHDLINTLDAPETDKRLALYMIRETAWQAMCEIDRAALAAYRLQHTPPSTIPKTKFSVDDL